MLFLSVFRGTQGLLKLACIDRSVQYFDRYTACIEYWDIISHKECRYDIQVSP